MPTSRPHPFRGFLHMMNEMERLRNLGRTGFESDPEATERTPATAWAPTTDVYGRGQDMVIAAEIAGVPPRDIDISVSEGVLTISGERAGYPEPGDDVTPYLRERFFGHFRRTVVLPEGLDERKIMASFDNGVVTITVPDGAGDPEPEPYHIRIVGGSGR